MLILLLADLPTMCYNDQVLGTWKLRYTDLIHRPSNDRITCSAKVESTFTKTVQLIAPNIAIDENGFTGTWSITYTQALTINVAGLDFYFYLRYERDPIDDSMIYSYCDQSMPEYGWYAKEGVTQPR